MEGYWNGMVMVLVVLLVAAVLSIYRVVAILSLFRLSTSSSSFPLVLPPPSSSIIHNFEYLQSHSFLDLFPLMGIRRCLVLALSPPLFFAIS
jgi:hypothetical protein